MINYLKKLFAPSPGDIELAASINLRHLMAEVRLDERGEPPRAGHLEIEFNHGTISPAEYCGLLTAYARFMLAPAMPNPPSENPAAGAEMVALLLRAGWRMEVPATPAQFEMEFVRGTLTREQFCDLLIAYARGLSEFIAAAQLATDHPRRESGWPISNPSHVHRKAAQSMTEEDSKVGEHS